MRAGTDVAAARAASGESPAWTRSSSSRCRLDAVRRAGVRRVGAGEDRNARSEELLGRGEGDRQVLFRCRAAREASLERRPLRAVMNGARRGSSSERGAAGDAGRALDDGQGRASRTPCAARTRATNAGVGRLVARRGARARSRRPRSRRPRRWREPTWTTASVPRFFAASIVAAEHRRDRSSGLCIPYAAPSS